MDNVDSLFPHYPNRVLNNTFPGGGATSGGVTLVLPTYEKQYFVTTSIGDEWISFYESLWTQASDSLQQSERIVLIGYNMPNADIRSRALLLWTSNKRAEVLHYCAGFEYKPTPPGNGQP